MNMALRISEEKARSLLGQCKWLLIVCVAFFTLLIIYVVTKDMDGVAGALFAVYWLAGVGYFIWLGRLAYGLRRSVVYYVGGTWLASSVVFLIAHAIAYSNISKAVSAAFEPKAI